MLSSESRLEQYLAQLKALPFLCDEKERDSCCHMIAYYRTRARYKRIAFRLASVALILLGACLPAVAVFADQGVWYRIAVSSMSVAIAILTGLISHFRWEVGWRSQTEAMFAIKAERAAWETAVAWAMTLDDEQKAIDLLAERFDQFRRQTYEIARGERGKFFKTIEPPLVKLPSQPET